MTIATGILVMVAMAVGGTLAFAVLYAVLTYGRNWHRELFSLHTVPFLFVGLAVGATTLGIGWAAKSSADEALRLAVDDIEADCDDQLTLLLHANACDFAYRYGATNNLSHEAVLQLCDYCCIDEFSLVGADGRFIDTTDPESKVGGMFFTDEEKQAPYRALLDGSRLTVRQRFRPSATSPDKIFKFFAMALPQQDTRQEPGTRNQKPETRNRFLQIGYLWESFEREFTRLFLPIFETRRIGEEGFCVVVNEKNTVAVTIPGHPDSKGKSALEIGFTPENLALPLGQIFRAEIYGTNYRCLAYPERIANYRIYAVVPLSERQGAAMALAGGVAFVLFAVFLVFRLILRKFREQQAKIDALREEEEKRRAADLALARSIQCAELRTDGTDGNGYHIATLMNAAREVGGDFYDYYELPDGRLVLAIADVSGKGVPAAFFMMKARMTLKSCVFSCAANTRPVDADVSSASPFLASAVANANVRLARNNPAEMFVTTWIGLYDPKTRTLDYVSAGHNPPVVVKCTSAGVRECGSTVKWLAAPRCPALGVFEGAKYRAAQMTLAPGDRLFLYTDGVTEAMNPAGELFGNERLEATLGGGQGLTALPETLGRARTPSAPQTGLIPLVSRALDTFVADAEQSDDITMLELSVKNQKGEIR